MRPKFFKTPARFREWLEKNHDQAKELLAGFLKKGSGKPSITWQESVDQALCFGWIDGVRKRIDDVSYTIRFTPRRKGSIWSAINIGGVAALKDLGLMQTAGLAAFAKRTDDRSRVYAFESAPKELVLADEKKFRANQAAWKFFGEQPPSYRRVVIHWIVTAKKEETRAKRLAKLIEYSAQSRRL